MASQTAKYQEPRFLLEVAPSFIYALAHWATASLGQMRISSEAQALTLSTCACWGSSPNGRTPRPCRS